MTKVVLPGQNTAGQPGGYAALDGAGGLLVPAYLEAAQQASAPAAPATGRTRLYVDNNGLLQLLPATGGARRMTSDWGSGAAFPASGMAQGDTYRHTSLGLHTYTGAAWRQEARLEVPDAATRNGLPTGQLYVGYQVYVTGQQILWEWDGTGWRFVRFYGNYHTDALAPTGAWTQGNQTLATNATVYPLNFSATDRVNPLVTLGTSATAGASNDQLTLNARGIWTFEGTIYSYGPNTSSSTVTRGSQVYLYVPGGGTEIGTSAGGSILIELPNLNAANYAIRIPFTYQGFADAGDTFRIGVASNASDGTAGAIERAWVTAKLLA